MIGFLEGKVASKRAPSTVLLKTGGVGYEVQVPASTYLDLPPVGGKVSLYTHVVIREDSQTLYGFATEREQQLFRQVQNVNGVGPRIALSILSAFTADQFAASVLGGDVEAFRRIPNVGEKTSERLVSEMKRHLTQKDTQGAQALQDAGKLLAGMGYKPVQVVKLIKAVSVLKNLTPEELVRKALNQAVSNETTRAARRSQAKAAAKKVVRKASPPRPAPAKTAAPARKAAAAPPVTRPVPPPKAKGNTPPQAALRGAPAAPPSKAEKPAIKAVPAGTPVATRPGEALRKSGNAPPQSVEDLKKKLHVGRHVSFSDLFMGQKGEKKPT